ncbi:penicillin-binding protein [Marinibacterium profundimaris]|uniref:peptidoglycan glycosyltransferase n=1 Tax=Marinibacterium profundimaris TaxID=1679460 RepID=A0A225NP93_9RHOB|nr:penicillin-binding protein [Marinibacterium profundimaris]
MWLAVVLLLAAGARDGFDAWIDATVLPETLADTSVELRDRDGALLRAYPVADGIWRLRPGGVDPAFVTMLLNYEDRRYHDHSGVDLRAMARAVAQALWYGHAVSGGSTLTMQVARLLEDGTTGQIAGKLRQMRVAWALDRRLGKDRVLDLYLTHAPYGGNLEGVRAAAQAWFGKPPARLDPQEAALLVALPQSPVARRPDRHPENARAARDKILTRALDAGLLDEGDYRAALSHPVPATMLRFPQHAAHLADALHEAAPDRARFDLTIDREIQSRLEDLARSAAIAAGEKISVAILAADHQSGEILASVGSPGYSDMDDRQGYVDMVTALRSPGSTLKPLIYALAFDRGLGHPETVIRDAPATFRGYAPQNFDGTFQGDVRMREALQLSLNVPVVKLTEALGPAHVMAALDRAGADPVLPGGAPGLALALGGVGLTLRDLVQLYAGLAGGGLAPPLHAEAAAAPAPDRLVSEVAAWQVSDILADLAPPPGAPPRRIAYKTGTSYGYRDAWAIGFDGRHVIGVWIGRADGTPVPGLSGAASAAPVLFTAFGRLGARATPLRPPPPATLILANADLPRPLQRFGPDRIVAAAPAPRLAFPPDGATFPDVPLVVKLDGGTAPFTLLANGAPVVTELHRRVVELARPGPGYSTLTVIDADGRSDRVRIRVR